MKMPFGRQEFLKHRKPIIYMVLACVLFVVLQVIWPPLAKDFIWGDKPPFIVAKLDELKADKILMDSIGDRGHFLVSYNTYDINRDTLPYSITIKGKRGELAYNATHAKENGDWKLVKETQVIREWEPSSGTSSRAIIGFILGLTSIATLLCLMGFVIFHVGNLNWIKPIKYFFGLGALFAFLVFFQFYLLDYFFPQ